MLFFFSGFNFSSEDLSDRNSLVDLYQKIGETFKFGFASRSYLGDPDFADVTQVYIITSPTPAQHFCPTSTHQPRYPTLHTAHAYTCRLTFLKGDSHAAYFDSVSRATVEVRASVVLPGSISSGFPEIAAWTQAKFCGQLPVQCISRQFYAIFFFRFH